MRIYNVKPGDKYGRLTIIKEVNSKNEQRYVLCKCDCGNIKTVGLYSLIHGAVVSCGCYQSEKAKYLNYKNGLYKTRLHSIWQNMKQRCYNEHYKRYKNYGARGIEICDEWLHDFKTFYDWAMANGYKNSLTIDRINNDGNYEPSNCRWVTNNKQQLNKSNNVKITYKGQTKTLSEWARVYNLKFKTLQKRLNSGWNIDKALLTPIMPNIKDLSGQRFGKLTVLSLANTSHGAHWLCKCDCGNTKIIKGYNLSKGLTKSCGCLQKQIASATIKRRFKVKNCEIKGA